MYRRLFHLLCATVCLLGIPVSSQAAASGGASAYVALDPALVVNIGQGARARFLQVEAQVKISDPEYAAAIERHDGAIRHQLILLLSDQSVESVLSSEGREQLRAKALTVIQRALEEIIGSQVVDGVYFTNFVVQ